MFSSPRFMLCMLVLYCSIVDLQTISTVEQLILSTCVIQRESVLDSLSICKSCILWLNQTLESLLIWNIPRFWPDLVPKFIHYRMETVWMNIPITEYMAYKGTDNPTNNGRLFTTMLILQHPTIWSEYSYW